MVFNKRERVTDFSFVIIRISFYYYSIHENIKTPRNISQNNVLDITKKNNLFTIKLTFVEHDKIAYLPTTESL